jgi:hypothetical protein
MKTADYDKYRKKALPRPVEPEAGAPRVPEFRHFAVIPVMDELAELPETLKSIAVALGKSDGRVGVLLVINHGPGAAAERKAANRELLKRLRAGDEVCAGGLTPGRDLFWIDAASPEREIERGVGEARRIGLDSALAMLDPATFAAALLFSLDADSRLASDYFVRVGAFMAGHPECGAVSIGVRHRPGATAAEEAAIRRYEVYMADYVEKLRAAGSPYAFHTIGSAFAVRAATYIAAGGMRVRSGAEDFYFLQAVCKVSRIGELAGPLVFPSSRPSDRVPFGTGPAVRSQLAGVPLPVYRPESFDELAKLIAAATPERLRAPEDFRSGLSPAALQFLSGRGFFPAWRRVLENLPPRDDAATAAFHQWFDGLKTLQFIKFCDPENNAFSG